HDAGEVEDGEGHRDHRQRRLGHQHDRPLVEAVGQHSGPDAEEQGRDELARHRDPDREAVAVRELEHPPAEGDGLHPTARPRRDLSPEVEPEVADAQRLEGGLPRAHELTAIVAGIASPSTPSTRSTSRVGSSTRRRRVRAYTTLKAIAPTIVTTPPM